MIEYKTMEIITDKEELWNLFYLSKEEADYTFRYFINYYKQITPYKSEIINSDEMLKRYCLMSFFIHYRVCNHVGTDFYIPEENPQNYERIDILRHVNLEHLLGQKIRTASDYLKLIKYYPFRIHMLFIPLSWRLFYFVRPNRIVRILDKYHPKLKIFENT